MTRIELEPIYVDAPDEWTDITSTVVGENPPITLAKPDGYGALQFSIALYEGGKVPDPTAEQLLDFVSDFGAKKRLGKPTATAMESNRLRLAAGSFRFEDCFLRVWYVSDGRNFAFVSLTIEWGKQHEELEDCEQIVRSIHFNPA